MSGHRFTAGDIFLFQQIKSLHASPARQEVVCDVQRVEPADDGYRSALWVFDLDGQREPRQITAGTALDAQPQWSPDGQRIAFLSDRAGGAPQPHLIDRDGGEARALPELPQGAESIAWLPDGRALLATGPVSVNPDAHGEVADAGDCPPPERGPDAPQVVWRLPYKLDGLGYTLAERIHLFRLDVDTGTVAQLTRGDFEVHGFQVSADGRRVAYSRTRAGAQHCTDIWVMNLDGTEDRRLTHDQASASAPSWSPDGRWIGFQGALDEGDAQARLWRIEMATGRVQALGDESIEIVPGMPPCWADDGRRFACVWAHRGLQQVVVVDANDGSCSVVVDGLRHVEHFAATPSRVVYTATSPSQAHELYACDWHGKGERQLSHLNPWWHDRPVPRVAMRRFTVPDGRGGEEEIEGWLMLPADHDGGALPLLVDVHGGPASYVLVAYTSAPHWPVLCSQGWAVLALNCVGSSSYGREFSARLRGRWGELDLQQQLAAVKALQAEGLADERVAISGKSYGGYLSAWAIGQTRVFRSAVVLAPVGNLETHYGTSDSGFYADPYSMCGEPFLNRETSVKLSPMKHVQKTCTPTLFLQGAEDERCPKCQSEELYVTIARAGSTPTEMVLYPGGSHHFWESGRPSHRLDALTRRLGWLTRWIDQPLRKPSSGTGPPPTRARAR
ncbi:MAG TPA: S9 family peptidase [Rhizobacter sp.]